MWIELSQEEAKIIANLRFGTSSTAGQALGIRFKAILAAGDEPRVLDAEGKVVSSNRLWDYSTEDDILEIADQRGVKLTPAQLDKLLKVIVHDDQWAERIEEALNEAGLTGEEAVI